MKRLLESMQEAVAFAKGDQTKGVAKKYMRLKPLEFEPLNFKDVREQMHLTQMEFATRFGFNLHTLRNWETGRRQPEQAVMAYLFAISKDPVLIDKVLRGSMKSTMVPQKTHSSKSGSNKKRSLTV